MSLPTEILYYIISFCDGFERENLRLVCSLFDEFSSGLVNSLLSGDPYRKREVLMMEPFDIAKLAECGHMDILNVYLSKHETDYNQILFGACKGRHFNIVENIAGFNPMNNCNFERGEFATTWDYCLRGLIAGGHIDLVEPLMDEISDLNEGLLLACLNGHEDLANLFIMHNEDCLSWRYILDMACDAGDVNAVKLIIKLAGNSLRDVDINYILSNACSKGSIDIIKMIIDLGTDDWDYSLWCAHQYDNDEAAELMIEMGADDNLSMQYACSKGFLSIAKIVIERGYDLNESLKIACASGHIDIVAYLLEMGANDWNGGLYKACYDGHEDIVELMIQKGANDLDGGLIEACRGGMINIVRLMIQKGATNIIAAKLVAQKLHRSDIYYELNAINKIWPKFIQK